VLSRRQLLAGGIAVLAVPEGRRVALASAIEPPVIDPEVRAAVARGPVRVIVELRLPDPSAADPGLRPTREQVIATARQAALARLSGTLHRLVRQYTTIPLLALEIGPDALLALETMGDLVVRVQGEQVRRPAAPR
jgi:hypothetical protein